MKITESSLEGVKIIEPPVFEDFRGEYIELYNQREFHEAGIDIDFKVTDISPSNQHVLKGIHGDYKTWKLTCCVFGKVYSVIIDCREDKPTFGKWDAFTLSERNRKQILVPPGFGNSFLVLSNTAVYHYQQSDYYDRSSQFTFKWDDPRFGIYWPVSNPILSERDRHGR